jgi:hypothetical protein
MQHSHGQNQAVDLPALKAALTQVSDDPSSSLTQICVRLILQSAEASALDKQMHDSITRRKIGGRPFSLSAKGFSDKERRSFYSQLEQAITNLIDLLSPLILFDDAPVEQSHPFKTGRLTNPHFSSQLGSPVIKRLRMIDARIKSKAAHAFIGLTVSSLRTIRGAVAAARQEIRTTRGAQSMPKRQLNRLDDGLMTAFFTSFGHVPTVSINAPCFLSFKVTYAALNLHLDEESLLNRAKRARQRLRQQIEKLDANRLISAIQPAE